MGMTSWRTTSGEWEWTPVNEALETSGIWPTKEDIERRKANIVAQVSCRPIYEFYMGEERIPLTSRFLQWWGQDVGREAE